MNFPFRKLILITAAIATAVLPAASFATGDRVASPAQRQAMIDAAKMLLAAKESPSATSDPFHSAAFYELVGGVSRTATPTSTGGLVIPSGPRTGRELLEAIATSLKPSGYFIMGGEPTLVFGQKRVKAGGTLTITFEGNEYTLEVPTIDRTNFTLRLNREEFTRPIK